MRAKNMRGAKERARPHKAREAMAAMIDEERMRMLSGIRPSERNPNVNWPRTWAMLISARRSAPVVELKPMEVAYDGRSSDGK